MHRRRLEFEAEPLVQVGELIGVVCLHGAGPRAHRLVHHAEHPRRRVQGEESTQRRQGDPGAQQQGGRVDRAARDDHYARTHRECMRAHARRDAHRGAVFDEHAPHVAAHDDARAAVRGVLQIGDERRLLGRVAAAHAAVAAAVVLRAAPNVAGQQAVVPLQALEPADQALIAAARLRVVGVDADPRGDGVEGS